MALTSRFVEGLTYAANLHAAQYRKRTAVPYVSHLLAVAGTALEHGADEDEAIAALLHDAIEDQGGAPTREEIRLRFGDRVVDIVDGCTDTEVVPKSSWRARKEASLAHLRLASPSVRLVSAADKLHNARAILMDYRAIGDSLWERFNASKAETLWYYRALVEAFQQGGSTPLIDEFERTVSALEGLVSQAPDAKSDEAHDGGGLVRTPTVPKLERRNDADATSTGE